MLPSWSSDGEPQRRLVPQAADVTTGTRFKMTFTLPTGRPVADAGGLLTHGWVGGVPSSVQVQDQHPFTENINLYNTCGEG